jgi:hypothetical protein
MPEFEDYYCWFCCNCGEGPIPLYYNEHCVQFLCQHQRCVDCLVGKEALDASSAGATRKFLNPELAPPTDPKSLVADGEEDYDEGECCEGARACVLTCSRADAREKPTGGELDYMLVAEHQLPIFIDELHPSTPKYTDRSKSPKLPGPGSWFTLKVHGLPKDRYPGSFYRAAERRYSKQGMVILGIWPQVTSWCTDVIPKCMLDPQTMIDNLQVKKTISPH